MSLSKPVYNLIGIYLEQLLNHPLRTKSITSCVMTTAANYIAHIIDGTEKNIKSSMRAYALFGLIYGHSVPAFFHRFMERLFSHHIKLHRFLYFLSERFIFTPFYQALMLYFLSKFELNSHAIAVKHMKYLYWPLLNANWRYLTFVIFFNICFVPPMLRFIPMGVISFIWIVYVSLKRRRYQNAKTPGNDSSFHT